VQERGWAGVKNGPVLRLMREADVEALVTTDRNQSVTVDGGWDV
jgi:hypothetical protein